MAFLTGIFNKPAAPAPAPAAPPAAGAPNPQAPAGAGPAIKQAQPANPGADPSAIANTTNVNQPAGGPVKLDDFHAMMTPKPADPNAPKRLTLADPLLQPMDPVKFRESTANANFAAGVPQELLQKAAAGNDPQALADVINHVAREAFTAATQLSHGLVESGARAAGERALGGVDSIVRNNLLRTQTPTNDVLKNPAVAPVFNAVKSQIAQANPQLAPDAVHQAAETYFAAMANAFTEPQRQAEQSKQQEASKGTDFSFLLQN